MEQNYFNKSSNFTDTPTIPIDGPFLSVQILWSICFPILFLVGVPGNICVICVLLRKPLRGIVANFLITLAIFNVLVLTVEFPACWAKHALNFHIRNISYTMCFLHRWLSAVSQSCTNWLLVVVTAIRLLYVKSSIKMYKDFTEGKARVIISALVSVLVISEFAMLQVRDIETASRSLQACDIETGTIVAWIRYSILTYIPFSLLIVLTILLYTEMKSSRQELMTKTSIADNIGRYRDTSAPDTATDEESKTTISNRGSYEAKLRTLGHFTMMLVLTNVQFLLTNMPLSLYYSSGIVTFDTSKRKGKENEELLISVFSLLFFSGYAINVIIYCLSGSRFRYELKIMVCSILGLKQPAGHLQTGVN